MRGRLAVIAVTALVLVAGLLLLGIRTGWWQTLGAALERGDWFDPAPITTLLAAVLSVLGAWGVAAWQSRVAARERRDHTVQTRTEQALARDEAWAARCRALLMLWPLPRVVDADPYSLGVFPSTLADAYQPGIDAVQPHGAIRPSGLDPGQTRPPYVPRPADKRLAELLGAQRLVLITGPSRAGKSRTAFEVAAKHPEVKDYLLIAPRKDQQGGGRAAIRALAELDPPPWRDQPALIWLDELESYLPSATKDAPADEEPKNGLNDKQLVTWSTQPAPRVVVLATIRDEEVEQRQKLLGEHGQRLRQTLGQFNRGLVRLPVAFDTDQERAKISELYPREAGRIRGGRLAEHLAGVPELLDRLDRGQASTPMGYWLVRAAVDWRRSGIERPASAEDLRALANVYLTELPDLPQTIQAYQRGAAAALDWACEPVTATAALLERLPGPPEGYRATDPVVDHLGQQLGRRLTSSAAWPVILARCDTLERVRVASAAWWLSAKEVAIQALIGLLNHDDPTLADQIAEALVSLVDPNSDPDALRAAYRWRIARGDEATALWAAMKVVELDPAESRATFQRLTSSANFRVAWVAAYYLHKLDPAEGEAAAVRLALAGRAPWGSLRTVDRHAGTASWLLTRLEEDEKVRLSLEFAATSHPSPELVAQVDRFAELDPDSAQETLQQLASSDDPWEAFDAAKRLAELDPQSTTARAAFEHLATSDDHMLAVVAAERLTELDPQSATARAAFHRLTTSDPHIALRAADGLRRIDPQSATARATLERVATSDNPFAVDAAERLIELDPDSLTARTAFQRVATASDKPWSALRAAEGLIKLEPDSSAARKAFQRLAVGTDTSTAFAAIRGLTELDPSLAQEALQQRAASDNLDALNAAEWLAGRDPQSAIARATFERFTASDDLAVALRAAEGLAGLDPQSAIARATLQRLATSDDPSIALTAARQLADLPEA